MATRIDLDVAFGEEVYVNHSKYEITAIDISITKNHFQILQTITSYKLKLLEGTEPNCTPTEYSRTDFLTKSEYRGTLIDLVNNIQQEL